MLENFQVDEPVRLHWQVRYLVTFATDFQRAAAVQNALMLGLRGDDVLLAGALAIESSYAFDGLIIVD